MINTKVLPVCYQQFRKQTLISLKKSKVQKQGKTSKEMDGLYIKNTIWTTNIKFKIYTNISYNVATYETPWQAEFWKQVLFIGRLRVDKKGKKTYLSSCKTDAYSSESHTFFSKHAQ